MTVTVHHEETEPTVRGAVHHEETEPTVRDEVHHEEAMVNVDISEGATGGVLSRAMNVLTSNTTSDTLDDSTHNSGKLMHSPEQSGSNMYRYSYESDSEEGFTPRTDRDIRLTNCEQDIRNTERDMVKVKTNVQKINR
ncbi:Hypp8210 [Branchiostoma lanceolatum]|uniref:Hypp8210 protein n=1 Tax=Branchiostoma lanceolatum TaxID=7740 RepID=A0A8K0ED41_BRALA|nr:Hypp8210 [Branchiostoma lanceolatum]